MNNSGTETVTDLKSRWVQALRSGKYAQDANFLRTPKGYCCIGVLCDVANPDKWTPGTDAFTWGDGGRKFMPSEFPEQWQERSVTLMAMNDEGVSFQKIADWIEANL